MNETQKFTCRSVTSHARYNNSRILLGAASYKCRKTTVDRDATIKSVHWGLVSVGQRSGAIFMAPPH